jgi:hypothetical protein
MKNTNKEIQQTKNQTKGVIAMSHIVQNIVTRISSKKQFGLFVGAVVFAVLALTGAEGYGQIRQFAESASASSEYNTSDPSKAPGTTWSAREMIGAPNVHPKCGDIRGAWAPTGSATTAQLELRFATPVYATQLNVYETNVPGSITRVEFISADGTDGIGQNFVVSTPNCPNIFTVNTSTRFLTNRVRLTVDTSRGGYEEIDAVELVGVTSTGGGGNNGGNNGGNPGGGQVNRAPFAPTLLSPAHQSANHNPAAINFQFHNNGDPDGDATSFYVRLAQYDMCAEKWVTVSEGYVNSTVFTLTNFQPEAHYAWMAFAVDTTKRSDPYFTGSAWSVFSTSNPNNIVITICMNEGMKAARATNALDAPVTIKSAFKSKNLNSSIQSADQKQGETNTGSIQTSVKIYTIIGKLVRTSESAGNALVLTGLPNGAYLVVVEKKSQDGRIHRTVKPIFIIH